MHVSCSSAASRERDFVMAALQQWGILPGSTRKGLCVPDRITTTHEHVGWFGDVFIRV
jgi:hypothetical protein